MAIETHGDPHARAPRGRRPRDAALTGLSCAAMAALFAHHAQGDRALGTSPPPAPHTWATLWRAGHLPGASLVGFALALTAAVGILGLLGDSPLDLRGDEAPWRPRGASAGPWWRDERVLLPCLLALLYVPCAGAFGLWDPWETHYAEVAREMLARDDWITPWWGPEGWFLSKPALLPWLLALGMSASTLFGQSFLPGAHAHAQEWFVRAPVVLLSLAALGAMQWSVGAACGRRAGFWSALVLGTTPFWSMVSHQAMTDVPFVALMTLSMAFLMRAVTTDPEARVEAAQLRLGALRARVSSWHLAVGALVLVALPQALYLLTRPVLFECAEGRCAEALRASRWGGVQLPVERFFAGSAGNSESASRALGVPGSLPWEAHFSRVPFAVSAAQGALWLALGVAVLVSLRRERRAQSLCFAMVYLFGALSLLAKGPAGLGLPEIVLALFILGARRWSLLRQLRVVRGAAIFLLCAAPWYTAVSVRLGREYFDRFVVHDLLARSLTGVHGDTGSAGYYVHQLAYGLFPWSALLPFALFERHHGSDRTELRHGVHALARLWFGVSFALFSLMVTRFHHYILPAVPPAAVLIGLWLSRSARVTERLSALAVAVATALLTRELVTARTGVVVGPARLMHLFTYDYVRAVPALMTGFRSALLVSGLLATAAALLGVRPAWRRAGDGLLGAVAVATTLWALWVYMPALSAHRSQRGLFEAYERVGGDAPLAAWALNWKGENFYSHGAVASFACGFASCPSGAFERWLSEHHGRRVFVLTERGRIAAVRSMAERTGGGARAHDRRREPILRAAGGDPVNRRELGAVALASTLLCGALDATGLWRGAERALVDGALRGEVSRDAIEAVARGMVRAGVGALGPTETGARAVFALAALASAVGLAWATGRALRGASGAWTLLVYATAPLVLSTARHATAAALSQAVFTSLFALSIALQAREPQRVQIGAPWLSRLAMLSFAWFTTRGGASTDLSTALESLGHALFPWTGLAAFAVFALAAPSSADDRERAVRAESLATLVVLLALHAWRGEAAAPLFAAPVAVAVALLLDRGALDRAGVWLVLLVMAVQARDLSLYPRPFVWPSGAPSPTVEGARASFSAFAEGALSPGGYALAAFVACVPAVVMGLCGARRARLAVIAGAVCAALLLSRGAERAWGRTLSSSAAWSALRAQSSAHDPVALLASSDEPPPALYASASLPRWRDGASATAWLREGDTRWLVLESAQLGALNSAHRSATGRNVAITGGYASGWMLAATWSPGRRSVNPLDAVVSSEAIGAPEGSRGEAYPIAREAVFEDALVLEGIDLSVPTSPPRGSAVRLGHHLRVLRAVPTAQVFVHVDGPCARINADHIPAAGRYPTPLWRAGDRVRDAYEFTIPWYCPRGRYAVWAGFFQGERRLRVTRGPHDADNRVLVTTLEVR